MSLSPEQCRAARALLGWSQDQLSARSSVAKATVANFEAGKRTPYDRTLADLKTAFEHAGVLLIEVNGEGVGVRLRKFRPGDQVRLRPGTTFWGAQSAEMRQAVGGVIEAGDLPANPNLVRVDHPAVDRHVWQQASLFLLATAVGED